MSPLEAEIPICAWIKQLIPTSRNGVSLDHRTVDRIYVITISDNLEWAYLTYAGTPCSQSPAHSQWYHFCLPGLIRVGRKLYFTMVRK